LFFVRCLLFVDELSTMNNERESCALINGIDLCGLLVCIKNIFFVIFLRKRNIMCRKLIYFICIVFVLAASSGVRAQVFIDDFNTPHIYFDPNTQTHDVTGTIWDDFIGWATGETVTALNASIDRPGQLFMSSSNGVWAESWTPLGPFLFKVVKGDFTATVKVTDYAGTQAAPVFHNDGGLMARAYRDDAGPGEDWVSIDYFPIWGCGNFLWSANNDARTEHGHNAKAWNSDRYLQLEREGNVFHARTSPDGVSWKEMSRSPLTRNDFDGLPLMVGLRHATYSATLGYVAFDDFRLEVIVKLKAYNPVPADGANNVTVSKLTWKPGDTAAKHDVYLGTDEDAVENANKSDTTGIYRGRQDPNTYTPGSLTPGQTYYWRIDEVEADGVTIHPGDVWSFTQVSLAAWNPSPADDAECVLTDVDLSWSTGATAYRHEVYFGTNRTAVAGATKSSPEFKGTLSQTTHDPGNLAKDTTYYWRIVEVEMDRITRYEGNIWSFRTLRDIPVYNPNLLGWWKLDGGCSGSDIVLDSSGYNHHGTLKGNLQWVAGYDGGALEFDGRDDYVELPIGPLIGSLTNSTFTIWVDSQPGGSWVRIFDFGIDTNVYMCLVPRWWFMDDMLFAITTGGFDNEIRAITSGFDLPTGWHHIAVTINASDQTIIFYYDGAEIARNTAATLTPKDLGNTTNNWLGRSHDVNDSYYLGSMDDFRIYNYALTADEILEIMKRPDPMIAWVPTPADKSTPDIEHTLPLSWSPGDKAAKHDVYFGTDANAVGNADISDTTGIYRGQQDPNSYSPPESVEPNQVYYWRIDEFNTDATVSTGRIWSFTVANYLIVDDFEQYNDTDNRIYEAWVDRFVNNTGMTVGYFDPPYAEPFIVNSGNQSMPLDYNNVNSPFYSEADYTFTNPQYWTRHGINSLTLWFRGIPASVGSFTAGPPIRMTAAGADIWGTADQFHFAYKQLSGNGSITARVVSLTNTDPWAKAGVMIRQSLEPGSQYAMVVVTPNNGVVFQYRLNADGTSTQAAQQTGITAPQWLKLSRSGNDFTAEYSANGTNWKMLGEPVTITMLFDVYIGLCLTSHNVNATCTAEFSNVNPAVTIEWKSQDIGIQSNIAEQLYVVLQDNAGMSSPPVIKPGATTIDVWTPWNIPLTQFTGVNLKAITKMTIGVGDRANPQPGSAGALYIDDIRLYFPSRQ
jgi:regulation of enolase protein 1 (concanavalin A-like superfamily)